jgi:hypothetical protein
MANRSYVDDVRIALSPRQVLVLAGVLVALGVGAIVTVGYGNHPRWLAGPAFTVPLGSAIIFRRWVRQRAEQKASTGR